MKAHQTSHALTAPTNTDIFVVFSVSQEFQQQESNILTIYPLPHTSQEVADKPCSTADNILAMASLEASVLTIGERAGQKWCRVIADMNAHLRNSKASSQAGIHHQRASLQVSRMRGTVISEYFVVKLRKDISKARSDCTPLISFSYGHQPRLTCTFVLSIRRLSGLIMKPITLFLTLNLHLSILAYRLLVWGWWRSFRTWTVWAVRYSK